METKNVNPLFQIAIRGENKKIHEIHKFFAVYVAIIAHKDAQFAKEAYMVFEHEEDMCFYAINFGNGNVLIRHGHIMAEKTSRKIVTLAEAEKIMQQWKESLRQPKQKRRERKIHKSNCVNKVRFTVTDQLGNTITVCGRYAYEWTINVNKNGMVIQTSFESRKKALNELRKLTGKKIQ